MKGFSKLEFFYEAHGCVRFFGGSVQEIKEQAQQAIKPAAGSSTDQVLEDLADLIDDLLLMEDILAENARLCSHRMGIIFASVGANLPKLAAMFHIHEADARSLAQWATQKGEEWTPVGGNCDFAEWTIRQHVGRRARSDPDPLGLLKNEPPV